MAGKRVLITGASSGIGLAAATGLARMGAEVLMHVRDEGRGEAARRLIVDTTGNERTALLLADFADLDAVRRMAEECLQRYDRIDVLVANAGAIYPERRVTAQGNELTFQVNHVAHFLLCNELEPLLAAAAPSRVISVSSDAHWAAWRGLRLSDLDFERGWSPFAAYAHSKLANIMFCYEHARRLSGTGITSTVMHPGIVHSGFGAAGYGAFGSLIHRLSPLIAATPEEGADTIVWLASSAEVEGVSGEYHYHRRPRRSSPASRDVAAQKGLWELSERLTRAGESR
jgi:NAD(P)-dependent dehydrogenase (short-subunit alcohol dehydrogenase family)